MEESSSRTAIERENMTVIKYNDVEVSFGNYNSRFDHTDQCEAEDDSNVSKDGEIVRNDLFHIDDPESSQDSSVENVCNSGITQGCVIGLESCNVSEVKDHINESRSGESCDGPGCQVLHTSPSASSIQHTSESEVVPAHNIDDEEILKRAKEEGRVTIVFPGRIRQDGCCRFVCELLKCFLYQRQQLPMTYDQMVFLQKQQQKATQTEGVETHRPVNTSGGLDWRRCQRTLQDLDEALAHLEALFSLSQVPRVLFMLGGSIILPTELYEINMEAVAFGAGENSLRSSACLRQIFRTLFVADILSDTKSMRLMTTTIMALGHRDCGVTGFKPKVDFRVPTKIKRRIISIASDLSLNGELQKSNREDLEDYIWFQVPVTIKGFCK